MKVVIAGGTGFMGRFLESRFLENGHSVSILTRKPKRSNDVYWDGETIGEWTKTINNIDVLINLAGKSVDCRYTEKNKAAIFSSRLLSTAILGEAIEQVETPPKLWINSSTATIYEHSLHNPNDEQNGIIGTGFSVEVAKVWEKTFFDCKPKNTRQVALRTAIVLGDKGGALVPMKRLAKLGVGGKLGKGNQMISWVHQEDVYRAIAFLIANTDVSGVVNVSAPNPVTNAVFMKTLQKAVGVNFGLPHFKFLLEIGAFLIRTETELVLKSRYVLPTRLTKLGFKFTYNRVEDALENLV
jgi:uncharacterized protein (TIGR01777 family)